MLHFLEWDVLQLFAMVENETWVGCVITWSYSIAFLASSWTFDQNVQALIWFGMNTLEAGSV